jgi:hypothetical protein
MKNNWFDNSCWIILGVSSLYTTIYSTYKIIEAHIR